MRNVRGELLPSTEIDGIAMVTSQEKQKGYIVKKEKKCLETDQMTERFNG